MKYEKLMPVLGGVLLALTALLLAVWAAADHRPSTTWVVEAAQPSRLALSASRTASSLTSDQERLVAHLSAKYKQPTGLVKRIVATAYNEAVQVGMSPLLVLAIVMKESSFDPAARSGYGAVGLMQVVPRFHMDKLSAHADPEITLHRPEVNIRVGTTILAEYQAQKRGSLSDALAKYSGKARGYAERVFLYKKELEGVKSRPILQVGDKAPPSERPLLKT